MRREVTDGSQPDQNGCLREPLRYEYASVRSRWLAGLVDWAVALVWGAVAWAVVWGPNLLWKYPFGEHFLADLVYYFGIWVVSGVLILRFMFNAISISSGGDTFGHRLFGLRVEMDDGRRIGWRRALTRQFLGSPLLFAYFLPLSIGFLIGAWETVYWLTWGLIIAAVLAMVNHFWMALDDQVRGWHDTIAGTVVVREVRQDDQ